MFLRAIKKLTSENPCLLSLLEVKYLDDDQEMQMLAGRQQERSSQTITHVLDSFRDPGVLYFILSDFLTLSVPGVGGSFLSPLGKNSLSFLY